MHKPALPTTHNSLKLYQFGLQGKYLLYFPQKMYKFIAVPQVLLFIWRFVFTFLFGVIFSASEDCCMRLRHSVHFISTLESCTSCLISQCHFSPLIVSSFATTCSDAGGRHQQQHRLRLQLYWHTNSKACQYWHSHQFPIFPLLVQFRLDMYLYIWNVALQFHHLQEICFPYFRLSIILSWLLLR